MRHVSTAAVRLRVQLITAVLAAVLAAAGLYRTLQSGPRNQPRPMFGTGSVPAAVLAGQDFTAYIEQLRSGPADYYSPAGAGALVASGGSFLAGQQLCKTDYVSRNFESSAIYRTESQLAQWMNRAHGSITQYEQYVDWAKADARATNCRDQPVNQNLNGLDPRPCFPAGFEERFYHTPKHSAFIAAFPPQGPKCKHPSYIGNRSKHDTSKFACGTASFGESSDEECVIVSIGSRDEWTFEEDTYAQMKHCKIHTFDCTSNDTMPERIRDRTVFHRVCISSMDATIEGLTYMTWTTVFTSFLKIRPALVKLDIEGHEYQLMDSIQASEDRMHPMQLLMEIHARTGYMPGLGFSERRSGEKTAGELMALQRRLQVHPHRLADGLPALPRGGGFEDLLQLISGRAVRQGARRSLRR